MCPGGAVGMFVVRLLGLENGFAMVVGVVGVLVEGCEERGKGRDAAWELVCGGIRLIGMWLS